MGHAFPHSLLGAQPQEASRSVTSLHSAKATSGQEWPKSQKTLKRPLAGLLGSLISLSKLLSLKLCPVPHVPLPSIVP